VGHRAADLTVIVDTHVHVASTDVDLYPHRPLGTGHRWYETAPLTLDAYAGMMVAEGVGRAYLVQTMTAYSDDNSYVLDAAATDPDRFVAVVYVDLAESPVAALDACVARGARGVRVVTGTPHRPVPIDAPPVAAVLDEADRQGLEVVVTVPPTEVPALRDTIAPRPNLRVALDHCGFPNLAAGRPYPAARPLLDLAGHAHVTCKVSTINLLHALRSEDRDARPFVEHLVSHFGSERLMWASNYSETSERTYGEALDLARRACSRLSRADQARFLGDTALARWPGRR
jgi:L-fuconolactonase